MYRYNLVSRDKSPIVWLIYSLAYHAVRLGQFAEAVNGAESTILLQLLLVHSQTKCFTFELFDFPCLQSYFLVGGEAV